jgi:5'-AMP-activated protein kinase catalytic alpha subunit
MNKPNNLLSTPCGSPCYASPEMVLGKKYDGFKIDIWATGIILYAMLCGYLPFEENNNQKLFKKISECKFSIPFYITKDANDLINKILVKDPSKRISIEEIKMHPFYLKGKNLFEKVFNFNVNNNNNSKNSSTSLKSKNEQEFKITSSEIDISNIAEFNMSRNENNIKDNLNILNDDEVIYFLDEKSSKYFSNIKNKDNNKEKIVGSDNDKKKTDINFKKELKRQKYEYNIFDIKKNKFKTKKKINLNNINNTINNKNNFETKNYKVYRTQTHSNVNKKKNNEYE